MENERKLTIEILENGQVQVQGPIQNKILCYGMLECAKDAIREFKPTERSGIVIPKLHPVN